jgi:hypothetical protein
MYYAIDKETNKLKITADSLLLLKNEIKNLGKTEEDYLILEDVDMKYISRIVYVDGQCVYNNRDFWLNKAQDILEDYDEHEVLDFMGLPVNQFRYETERNLNASRLSAIDGTAGEVDYNITVGAEFISLFREECIKTKFEAVTPIEIGMKLSPVISFVLTGSFREAKLTLKTIENDAFLTEERMQKYEDMLDAADVITYATEEQYYYTASDEE